MSEEKTMDLSEFLMARIAEDEAVARAAGGSGHWRADGLEWSSAAVIEVPDEPGEWRMPPIVYDEGSPSFEEATHIARWDPARVLSECEAKRRIMARHGGRHVCEDGLVGDQWDEDLEELVESPCDDLKAITLPYADHPDFREEWRP